MVNLRKDLHGEGSLKGANLVILAYDNRVAKKDDVVTTHYLDARLHPGDRRAAGQTSLALVAKKDPKSTTGYNNSVRYSAAQFESIKESAGDNVTDLTDKDGVVVGKIYGVKADLMVNNEGFLVNTKTLGASDLKVGPDADGRDIRERIFDSMKAAKVARETAKAEAAASEPAPEKQEPVLVGAGAPEASTDQPELG